MNWESYLYSLLGGLIIGGAGAMLLLFNGRVAGISGILNGAMRLVPGERAWRAVFIGGLLAGGLAVHAISPGAFAIGIGRTWPVWIVAGLMVGFGARLGSGCTSGHGVCGIGRLSARSLVATATFTAAGALTVFVLEHLMGGI